MKPIDRSVPPPIHPVAPLRLPRPRILTLSNGIPVYLIESGTQNVLKLEIEFRAGRLFESDKMVSRTTEALLKEGTARHSGAEIAEILDFYGGTFSLPSSMDNSRFALFSLTKHFHKLIPIFTEILTEPTFPQKELNNYIERGIQRLKVDAERTDIVAYREITERMYGADHPYGYNSSEELYRSQRRDALVAHHRRCYTADNCAIFLSGRTNPDTLELLDRYLGRSIPRGQQLTPHFPEVTAPTSGREDIQQDDQLQYALRIGRRLFKPDHPDFYELQILNCVLGGYFGSRLMSNLREDKGMTYGISSSIDIMMHDGFFMISTEVGREFKEAAIEEIFREMNRLREELIDESEMEMVRNYMLGSLLGLLDGPFSVAGVVRGYIVKKRPLEGFEQFDRLIRTVTPGRLRELARKYLRPEEMWVVSVG